MAIKRTVKSFEAIPSELKALKQWCCWKEEPDDRGRLTKVPYHPTGYRASSTDPDQWSTFEAVKLAYEDKARCFDGVGFFFNGDYTGADFDHCMSDGWKGEIADSLTIECLKKLDSYTEISQSGTGVHCITKGTIPRGRKTENYEMYCRARFFVMTGDVLNTHSLNTREIREDQAAITEVYSLLFPADKPKVELPAPFDSMAQVAAMRALRLTDDEIIELASKAKNGSKFTTLFRGSSAGYPSDSEADQALAFILAFYTGDEAQILRIIARSGLWDEKWERTDYQQRTIGNALSMVTERYSGNGSGAPNAASRVEWAMGHFVDPRGVTQCGYKDDKGDQKTKWISDGYAYLSAILEDCEQNPPERYFVIRGKPVSAEDEFELTIKISDFVEDRSNKILNNMWAEDELGTMNLSVIKKLSPKPVKHIRILSRPVWVGDELVAPGLTSTDTRFKYERKVHVDFSNVGDPTAGREAIIKALLAFDPKNTTLLFATVLGAPVIAKLWPGDRYCLFIQGTTQQKKTTAVMLFLSMYGQRYYNEASLVRWGDGATGNATEHLAAKTGPFPFLLDNYKQYTDKDPAALQRLIHAVVEGTEKDRLNRNSELRPSMEYQCSLLITGEQFPGQDAATRARIIELLWTDAINLDYLTEAQGHIEDINSFGKAWLQWLNSADGQEAMREYAPKFDSARLRYLKAANNTASAGRLASNAAVVALVWEIFNQWPEGHDLAEQFFPYLKVAIDEHILNASADVGDQLDGEKFIAWLKAELYVGRYYVTGRPGPLIGIGPISEPIGHFNPAGSKENREEDEVLILPEVLSAKLLPAWQRTTNGTRTDKKALLRQLVSLGYLRYDESHRGFSVGRRLDGKKKRVHAFLNVFTELEHVGDESGTAPLVPDNRDAAATGTRGTRGTRPENGLRFEGKNSQESITNYHGNIEGKEKRDTQCNNDINTGSTGSTKSMHTNFTGTNSEPVEQVDKPKPQPDEPGRDCGSCPAALKGDKSAIKCDPCIFLGRAEA